MRIAMIVSIVVVVDLLIILAWKVTPLAEWTNVDRLAALAEELWSRRFGPLLLMVGAMVANLVAVPIHAILLALALVLAPWPASLVAFSAAFASSLITYFLGRRLGAHAIERWFGARAERSALLRRAKTAGVGTMVVVRFIPLGPFPIVNALCGAVGVPLRSFALATALVLLPGHVSVAFMTSRVGIWLERGGQVPSWAFWGLGGFVALLVAALAWSGYRTRARGRLLER